MSKVELGVNQMDVSRRTDARYTPTPDQSPQQAPTPTQPSKSLAKADPLLAGMPLRGAGLVSGLKISQQSEKIDEAYTCAQLNEVLKARYGQAYTDRFHKELEMTVASKGYSVLSLLFKIRLAEEFDEMCRGGQVRIPYDETLFQTLKGMGGQPRKSSHYANIFIPTALHQVPNEHFGIDGEFFPTVLFGRARNDMGENYIYIQAERNSYNPSAGLLEKARHVMDTAEYAWTQRNQGPYGSSAHTDANPMGGTEARQPAWRIALHPRRFQNVAMQSLYVARMSVEQGLPALARMLTLGLIKLPF